MVHMFLSLAVLLAIQAVPPVPPAAPQGGTAYVVGPNDVLGIKVLGEADLTGTYAVDSDGTIRFPFLDRVPVGGRTVQEIELVLSKLLSEGFLNRPQVSVVMTSYRSRSIYVLGEVRNPAKYNIEGQRTLVEVIAHAGSFTPNAAQTINVLRYKDGLAGVAAGAPVVPGGPRGA